MQALSITEDTSIPTLKLPLPTDCIHNIYNYLDSLNIISFNFISTKTQPILRDYLIISYKTLLNQISAEQIEQLNSLQKKNRAYLSEDEDFQKLTLTDSIYRFKRNYIRIFLLSIKYNINLEYDELLKIIKIIILTSDNKKINKQIDFFLPILEQISIKLNKPLSNENLIALNNLSFFKTTRGDLNTSNANCEAIDEIFSPWPKPCLNINNNNSHPYLPLKPYLLIKYFNWNSIQYLSQKKILRWSRILQILEQNQLSNSYLKNILKSQDQFLLSPTKLDIIAKTHDFQPRHNNYFLNFHNIFNALIYISRKQLPHTSQYSCSILNLLSLNVLQALVWRGKIPYTQNQDQLDMFLSSITQQWGNADTYFKCCSTTSIIIILSFQESLKIKNYNNKILTNDLNIINSLLLRKCSIDLGEAKINAFLKKVVEVFRYNYNLNLQKYKIHENKLTQNINIDTAETIINNIFFNQNPSIENRSLDINMSINMDPEFEFHL